MKPAQTSYNFPRVHTQRHFNDVVSTLWTSSQRYGRCIDTHNKGGSRHKVHHHEKTAIFFIRHFNN